MILGAPVHESQGRLRLCVQTKCQFVNAERFWGFSSAGEIPCGFQATLILGMSQLCIFDAWNPEYKFALTFLYRSWYNPMNAADAAQIASLSFPCFLPGDAWEDLGKHTDYEPNQSTNSKQSHGLKIFFLLDVSIQHWCDRHSLPKHVSTFFEDALLHSFPFSAAPPLSPPLSSLLPLAGHLSLPFPTLVLNSFPCMLSPLITSSNQHSISTLKQMVLKLTESSEPPSCPSSHHTEGAGVTELRLDPISAAQKSCVNVDQWQASVSLSVQWKEP